MKGKKIYLRAIEETDIPLLSKWNNDLEIIQYMPPRFPNNIAEQKKWFESQSSVSKKKLIIIDSKNGKQVGMLGIMNIDQQNKNCEIGITIGEKDCWGKGYAEEAMSLGMDFLFNQYNMHIIHLTVFETNKRGIAFFEKIGFKKDGIFRDKIYKDGKYVSVVIMSKGKR